MNMQEDITSLQRKLTQQDELFQDLKDQAGHCSVDEICHSDKSFPEPNESIEDLVKERTQQLERAVKDLNDTQAALLHAQKMESVGQLAAGMAHEINTPLQYIGGNLEFMKQAFDELAGSVASLMNVIEESELENPLQAQQKRLDFVLARLPKAIAQSTEGVETVSRIVRAMRGFSHTADERIEADINDAIESTLIVSKGEWKYVADIDFEPDEDLPKLLCMPGELNQAFLNMIVNAAHAIEDKLGDDVKEKGLISISTEHDSEYVRVKISDTGAGIPNELAKRIFDQFFTTKPVGKGTGQGLSICRSIIVDKHGGKVEVQSALGKGTTFTVSLPRNWKPDDNSKRQYCIDKP